MSAAKSWPGEEGAVFDRRHLGHYTMQDQRLAAEVLGLFLAQLPATLQLLDAAATPGDWKFAVHALKGSAAAVGARKLQSLALDLESSAFPLDEPIRLLRLQALRAAAAEFREAARRAYPDASATP